MLSVIDHSLIKWACTSGTGDAGSNISLNSVLDLTSSSPVKPDLLKFVAGYYGYPNVYELLFVQKLEIRKG